MVARTTAHALNMIKKIAEIADFDLYIEQNTIATLP